MDRLRFNSGNSGILESTREYLGMTRGSMEMTREYLGDSGRVRDMTDIVILLVLGGCSSESQLRKVTDPGASTCLNIGRHGGPPLHPVSTGEDKDGSG